MNSNLPFKRQVKYSVDITISKTPCPFGMKATRSRKNINDPFVVKVGTAIECECPYLIERIPYNTFNKCGFVKCGFDVDKDIPSVFDTNI